jgi:hypothetical protein
MSYETHQHKIQSYRLLKHMAHILSTRLKLQEQQTLGGNENIKKNFNRLEPVAIISAKAGARNRRQCLDSILENSNHFFPFRTTFSGILTAEGETGHYPSSSIKFKRAWSLTFMSPIHLYIVAFRNCINFIFTD